MMWSNSSRVKSLQLVLADIFFVHINAAEFYLSHKQRNQIKGHILIHVGMWQLECGNCLITPKA